MEREGDLRDLWEAESMGMGDIGGGGEMMLLLGSCGANDAIF